MKSAPAEICAEISALAASYHALEIILCAPLWPHRDDLTEAGQVLHDAMVATGKEYAKAIAGEEYTKACDLAAQWTGPLHAMMDDPAGVGTDGRAKMAAVWKYYVDRIADWSQIQQPTKGR